MAYQDIRDEEMRRRKVQQAMLQQAMAPQRTQYAGNRAVPYSPLQGLSTLGQALIARSGREASMGRVKEAEETDRARRAKLAEGVMRTYSGTPQAPYELPPEQQFEGEQIPGLETAAVRGDPRMAMLQAASMPETEKMGTMLAAMQRADAVKARVGPKQFSRVNPKDFTQGSVRRFEKSGDYDDLVSIKQLSEHAKDFDAVQTAGTRTDQAMKKIDYILDEKNKDQFELNFGGYNAYATSALPSAQNMKVKIESLKSDLKMAGLELMRSGGSVGQMTEREWPIVQNMIDSIDPRLGEKEARDAFKNIRTYMNNIRDNAKNTYKTNWEQTQFYKGIESPKMPSRPEDVPADVWEAMTPEEQALWK
jgi:hypothetical protein